MVATVAATSLLILDNLCVSFARSQPARHVLAGVSLDVQQGECVALVGESGSGKTITCLSALGLLRGAKISGRLFWNETSFDLSAPSQLTPLRGRRIAMLPQNFSGVLNPVRTVGAQMSEIIRFHHGGTKVAAFDRATSLLEELGVSVPDKRMREFPHQQSGGILQRIALAMALSCEPELLIADEPTSALDVTSQHVLLELLKKIGTSRHLALLLVSHNLAVVGHLAHRVFVLADGVVVESGLTTQILTRPTTDTTGRLLKAAQSMELPS
jgi:ABC-type dipeptide/oligopeptide/nickel transport system ATPase component